MKCSMIFLSCGKHGGKNEMFHDPCSAKTNKCQTNKMQHIISHLLRQNNSDTHMGCAASKNLITVVKRWALLRNFVKSC